MRTLTQHCVPYISEPLMFFLFPGATQPYEVHVSLCAPGYFQFTQTSSIQRLRRLATIDRAMLSSLHSIRRTSWELKVREDIRSAFFLLWQFAPEQREINSRRHKGLIWTTVNLKFNRCCQDNVARSNLHRYCQQLEGALFLFFSVDDSVSVFQWMLSVHVLPYIKSALELHIYSYSLRHTLCFW